MNDKELYQQKKQAQIDEWRAEVDKLKAKASAMSADAQMKFNDEINALEAQIEKGKSQLGEISNASAEAWESLTAGVESAWDSIATSFKQAADKFKR